MGYLNRSTGGLNSSQPSANSFIWIYSSFHLKIAFSPKPISEDRAGISLIRYPAPPLTSTQYHHNSLPANGQRTVEKSNSVNNDEPEDELEILSKIEKAEGCENSESTKTASDTAKSGSTKSSKDEESKAGSKVTENRDKA
ncbi:unnamed protein product [Trichobilharzia regenti]|uniref:Ovule protein n=1 Tax=Trichobilharzia regenti TaxID=157069 RepID=A0A183X4B6_TRIRE|nr:unnamed protein product [Trichobilharzia regenti]VDQ15097.1 unnamed protein product [Trichobilharzia regenti]